MASRDLNDLIPEVKEKALKVQQICKEAGGYDLLIYCTLRSVEEQARLYRQSRSRNVIDLKIQKFRDRGFDFLADIIESVGPCNGPHVTSAAPGESWHNYGHAWDAVPLISGKPIWNYQHAKTQWDIYAQAVRENELQWGGDWNRFRDYTHAQLLPNTNPLKMKTPELIKMILDYRKHS